MGQKTSLLAVGLIIFAIILTILFIVTRVVGNFGSNSGEKDNKTEISKETKDLVPISKIIGTPIVYEGYTVSVEDTVEGWSTNKSFYFAVENQNLFGDKNKRYLFVIAKDSFQLPQDPDDNVLGLGENSKILANGRVVIYNREQLENALGVSLEDPKVLIGNSILENWELAPVLLLSSYEIVSD